MMTGRTWSRSREMLKRTFVYDWVRASRARNALARWTPHDDEMREFYGGLIAPGDLCFDVGANVGNRTKIFLALGARVVAVEPQRRCAAVLERAFGRDPRFSLVGEALGSEAGSAEMLVSDADTLSSLSPAWVDAVVKSGRFAERRWDRTQTVATTTLDHLIAQHGAPAFIKVDVEGFESEVIKGLSKPVKALSLEFTPEFLASTRECLERLEALGAIELNFSVGESMRFVSERWVSRREMEEFLSDLESDPELFGDVYVRFPECSDVSGVSVPAPSAPRFVPVHGRWRAYDRCKQGIKRRSPEWFVGAVQAAVEPYSQVRRRALHRQRIRENLPEALHGRALDMYSEARTRWNRGERAPTGPLMEMPLGRSPYRVWLRPGTCDVILYDDIMVQEQYGSLPLRHVRTILDAGANIGLASSYFLWRAPEARVLALEPDPVNYELCTRNLAVFGDRAVVIRAGLWSEPCRIQVEPANLGTWASTVAPVSTPAGSDTIEALDVPTLLDRYGIERLDLLKIDIEGAEREVFAASDLRWLDRVGCIQVELEEPSRDTFFRALHGRGFEFLRHHEVTVAVRPNWDR